ncbi:MAG TPA: NADH-quinone oxidoreductase subunit M, partial [Limnochordia bacterium]|nr:NADH-quinone oxidoreductase subunit M [Limnochordia bacterium]
WAVQADWLPSIGASYHLGVDGISLPLLLLTAGVGLLCLIALPARRFARGDVYAWLLLLQGALFGVFLALDTLLFFVFWELMLVPAYFLIAAGGGAAARRAALRFFMFTFGGSAFLLLGILILVQNSPGRSFDMLGLAAAAPPSSLVQGACFLLLLIGLGVKMPFFPLHGWLPSAYTEAPPAVTMFLSGVMAKAGAYGLFRIVYPMLPDAAGAYSLTLATLGAITIIYGAALAYSRRTPQAMFAYSSLSHMGFVLLGLAAATPMGLAGALFVMISHGLISPLLFFLSGIFSERGHVREFPDAAGLYTAMPIAGVFFAFAALANLGLPGLSAFAGEFFTLLGTYPVLIGAVVAALIGLILAAAYNLRAIRQLLMGEPGRPAADLGGVDLTISVPLVLGIAGLGLFPTLLFRLFDPPVTAILSRLGGM